MVAASAVTTHQQTRLRLRPLRRPPTRVYVCLFGLVPPSHLIALLVQVPDYALIGEIMLYAEGFVAARLLAQKMVKMYKLCSEQLSQQDHYDYGMRQVKSVLVMAGEQKRANPELHENISLIRAMLEANIPRFLADDLPLFEGIIGDLYPSLDIPAVDYGALKSACEEALTRAGLQSCRASSPRPSSSTRR